MKRNKLIDSSAQSGLFTLNKPKRYHLVILSFFALAGIFITSIVLATSTPTTVSTDSQVIDLPNLSVEMQNLYNPTPSQSSSSVVALPVIEPEKEIFQELDKYDISTELALQEQNQIEQLAANESIEEISALNWQEVTVKSGDNLSLIFPRVGLTARDVYNVAQLGKDIKPLLNLKPGQILRFGFSTENSDKKSLEQLELQLSHVSQLQLTAIDSGYEAKTLTRNIEYRQAHAIGEIKSSLFEAGQDAGLSDKLIMELAYIFGWDIDLSIGRINALFHTGRQPIHR